MHKFIHILLFLAALAAMPALAQKETAYPFVRNFKTNDYHAHAQNFALTSDASGMLYVGNFAGVLQYDGETWRLIPTGKRSKVSALASSSDGMIYVGARGEAGKLVNDEKGALYFVSVIPDELLQQHPFTEINHILVLNDDVIYVADNQIFILNKEKVTAWKASSEIMGAFVFQNQLYLRMKTEGLCTFSNQHIKVVPGATSLSQADVLTAALRLSENKMLLAFSSSGLKLFDGQTLSAPPAQLPEILNNNPVTCGIRLSNNHIALGTGRTGIVILDQEFGLIQIVNKEAGLQNSFVRQLHATSNNSLYAALNNGVSLIGYPSVLGYFNEASGLEGGVKDILRFNEKLYVATYQGLYSYLPQQFRFEPHPGINTAVWDLQLVGNQLIVASSGGVFLLNDMGQTKLSDHFSLSLASDATSSGHFFAGETDGLRRYELKQKAWTSEKLPQFQAGVSQLKTIGNNLWGWSDAVGLFSLNTLNGAVRFYGAEDGIAEKTGIGLQQLNGRLVLTSSSGLLAYHESKGVFEPYSLIVPADSTQQNWYSALVSDVQGHVWATDGNETHITRYKSVGNGFRETGLETSPIANKVVWSILAEDERVWFGGPDGLFMLNRNEALRDTLPVSMHIRRVVIGSDSVLVHGSPALAEQAPVVSHALNSIRFEFAAPFHAVNRGVEYQYFLEGFDDARSLWSTANVREYTNLPGGKYTFHVQARNVYGQTSEVATFSFQVKAPWYSSALAIILYVVAAGLLIWLIVVLRNKNLLKEKKVLEERIRRRTAEVVKQKEEIEQQSRELADKNDELEKINTAIKYINAEVHLDNLMQSLLEKLRIIRTAEKSVALLLDHRTGQFQYKAAVGYPLEQITGFTLSLSEAESRYLSQTEEVFEDIFVKTDFASLELLPDLQQFMKPRSMMVLVIRIETRVEAFLIFENFTREKAFEQRELSLMRNAKEHIISAIIRTRILDDLQQTLHNLKDTQEQLIQSEKLASLGQLTAGIAHEIQNPLNFVNNFASLSADLSQELIEILEASKEAIPADSYEEAAEVIGMIRGNVLKINEHGKRVEGIVKGMLQHSRGKTGEFEEVELNNLVSEYASLAYHGMRAKDKTFNTAINTDLDPAIGKVQMIPQDLSRVILNITNNACYAVDEKARRSPQGFRPEVRISTRKAGDKIEISIRDNGTGIPPHVIEKIFNPFFTTKPTGQGTGLGLSMSFDIVNKLHKGKLEVKSAEGEYTEFIITIPEKQPPS